VVPQCVGERGRAVLCFLIDSVGSKVAFGKVSCASNASCRVGPRQETPGSRQQQLLLFRCCAL